jgi:hypothetical protein
MVLVNPTNIQLTVFSGELQTERRQFIRAQSAFLVYIAGQITNKRKFAQRTFALTLTHTQSHTQIHTQTYRTPGSVGSKAACALGFWVWSHKWKVVYLCWKFPSCLQRNRRRCVVKGFEPPIGWKKRHHRSKRVTHLLRVQICSFANNASSCEPGKEIMKEKWV